MASHFPGSFTACPGIFSFTDSVFDRNITIFLERVSPQSRALAESGAFYEFFNKSPIHTKMNTRLLFSALLWLAAFAPCGYADTLRGKTPPLASPDQVPEGLAKSDWQSIRAAYEAGRHAFQPVEGGWQAGNPGQQWLTAFDGQGFTVTPDGGGWTWGLELAGYGKATGVQQEGERFPMPGRMG